MFENPAEGGLKSSERGRSEVESEGEKPLREGLKDWLLKSELKPGVKMLAGVEGFGLDMGVRGALRD